ncbi:hypothetical protein [Streptomyces sp. NPDC005078]|uniref:hypothetical protein n=1 Tax=unclassified Streptomyces TaxID=2593676 RepID=UPI0033B06815
MTTFAPCRSTTAGKDPAKRVNYTYGMVLGVDDFTQEFSYLSAKDRSLARTIVGYGTVAGLATQYEKVYEGTPRGPRLSVRPGIALCPSGRFVHVHPAQCAYLVEWLAAHRAEVVAALGGTSGPLELYAVLGHAECLTDAIPIPGEPCRTEDRLTAPSRVRDGFRLQLRLTAPDQREEEAVRRFVGWLRKVPVVEGTGTTERDFHTALVAASGVNASTADPCPPVTGFFAAPPPASLGIPEAGLGDYLRAAWRIWVTELLPCWRPSVTGCGCGCANGQGDADGDADCVLLARVNLEVAYDAVGDRLLVGPGEVGIDETHRPYLVHARFLQEQFLTEAAPVVPAALGDAPTAPTVVAGGWFDADGEAMAAPRFSYGGLRPVLREAMAGVFDLVFDGYDPAAHYVVTGSVIVGSSAGTHVVETVTDGPGLAVRIRRANGGVTEIQGFQLQITRFEGGGA